MPTQLPRIFRDADADLSLIRSKKVAVIGYGNQGAAHADNLRDSEVPVVVGVRAASPSGAKAAEKGHRVLSIAEAVAWAEVVMVLIADEAQPDVYAQHIAPHLRPSTTLAFAHGFAIHYKKITPPPGTNVFLVAPKGPGYQLRTSYLAGKGLPCLIACTDDSSPATRTLALSYAKALGCTHAGALLTSFREETETDLFGEQAVLCGGLPSLLKAGFDTLVAAGYSEEMAYIECVYEIKLIVDLLDKGGLTFLREAISNTAEYGGYRAGDYLIDASVREKMRSLLQEIQNGTFADRWLTEHRAGKSELYRLRQEESSLPQEAVGAQLRAHLLKESSCKSTTID